MFPRALPNEDVSDDEESESNEDETSGDANESEGESDPGTGGNHSEINKETSKGEITDLETKEKRQMEKTKRALLLRM